MDGAVVGQMELHANSCATSGPPVAKRAAPTSRPEMVSVRRERSRLLIALVIGALMALLMQSLITQSHVHPILSPGRSARPGGAVASAKAELDHRSRQRSDDCAICREIAQAGHYVASALPSFPEVDAQGFWRSPVTAETKALRALSHAWQSRGPPPVAAP